MARGGDVLALVAADVMTRNPITIAPDTLAAEILLILEQRKITSVIVADATSAVVGVVHVHDLWRTEMF
jgi:arabinose-5-phosphate isomerase